MSGTDGAANSKKEPKLNDAQRDQQRLMLPRAWAAALNGLIWLKCSRRLAQRLIVLTAAHHRLVPLWMSTGFMACSMSYCCSLAHCMRGCCLIVTGLDSLLPLLEVECKRFCMTSLTVFVFLFPDSERERVCVCLSTYLPADVPFKA